MSRNQGACEKEFHAARGRPPTPPAPRAHALDPAQSCPRVKASREGDPRAHRPGRRGRRYAEPGEPTKGRRPWQKRWDRPVARAYETWSCGRRSAGLASGPAPTTCPEGEMTATLTKATSATWGGTSPESRGAQRRTRPWYRAHPRGRELGSGQGEGRGAASEGPRVGDRDGAGPGFRKQELK